MRVEYRFIDERPYVRFISYCDDLGLDCCYDFDHDVLGYLCVVVYCNAGDKELLDKEYAKL